MTSKLAVNGRIIKWARDSLNLSVEDVAVGLRQEPEVIESWEAGSAHPTYAQLERLAYQILKRPVAIFFFPEPPAEKSVDKEFRTLPAAMFAQISPSVRKVIRRAQAWQLSLQELTDSSSIAEGPIWQEIVASPSHPPEDVARAMRRRLGISVTEQRTWRSYDRALAQWRTAAESAGVAVFKAPFYDDSVSGFCLFDESNPIICINNSTSKSRQIFTLAHELAHIVLRVGDIDQYEEKLETWTPQNRRLEIFCNQVAAEFLLPKTAIEAEFRGGEPSEDRIKELAESFSVSREVVLRAASDRGLVSEERYELLAEKWNEQARAARSTTGGRGDYWNNQASYLSTSFSELVLSRLYRNQISQDTAAEYLQIRPTQVSSLESVLLRRAGR